MSAVFQFSLRFSIWLKSKLLASSLSTKRQVSKLVACSHNVGDKSGLGTVPHHTGWFPSSFPSPNGFLILVFSESQIQTKKDSHQQGEARLFGLCIQTLVVCKSPLFELCKTKPWYRKKVVSFARRFNRTSKLRWCKTFFSLGSSSWWQRTLFNKNVGDECIIRPSAAARKVGTASSNKGWFITAEDDKKWEFSTVGHP